METLICVNGVSLVALYGGCCDVRDVPAVVKRVLGRVCVRWRALPSAGSSCTPPPGSLPPSAALGAGSWLQRPAPCRGHENHTRASCVLVRSQLFSNHRDSLAWPPADPCPHRCQEEPACRGWTPALSDQQETAWGYAALHFQELSASIQTHRRKWRRGEKPKKGCWENPTTIKTSRNTKEQLKSWVLMLVSLHNNI